MNRRTLILLTAIIAAVLLTALIVLSVFSHQPKPKPINPQSTGLSTSSPTPSVPPESQEEQVREESLAADAKQPFVKALPKNTSFWSLTYEGKSGNLYLFKATIYSTPGTNPQTAINSQRPYIEAFIRGIGQPDGTYTISYTTTAPDTY